MVEVLLFCRHQHRSKFTEENIHMTHSSRVTIIGLMGLWVLLFAPASWAQAPQRAPILDQVAKTFGIDSWDQVEAVRYTWNGEITGLFKAAHKWEWEPKTNKVSFEGTDKDGKPVKVSYVRTDLSSQSDAVKNQIDPSFINDNYWVLFPFHAYWDKSASAIDRAGYKKAGPILFSTEHRGFADGKPLHIFISDVAVKLTGSDAWMKAQ